MKVSVNWLKKYLDFELPEVSELAEIIGSKLGEIEGIEYIGPKYEGIIIVKVISAEKHPNADKLKVCKVDDGGVNSQVERDSNRLIQVVCGAPNVVAGMMAAWLPPKSTVPSSYDSTDPLVLEVRELRGVASNGMLASPKELALGDSHEGLLELDVTNSAQRINEGEVSPVEAMHNYIENPDIKPGDDFRSIYELDDTILNIENKMFTHRPDCFGILGVAREVAGILGHKFTSPDLYKNNSVFSGDNSQELELINEIPDMVPRISACVFTNLTVGPSPVKMQTYLSRVGIRPISNIVDITNYFMFLTGQPLHAYDYDKVKKLSSKDHPVIVVRYPKQNESLTLLNGKTIKLSPKDMMIATDQHLIGLGGIMGGGETEVDNLTKNIILESANFNMYQIRRTAMAHGLFTDAFTRFSKGQSPLQNTRIIRWASDEIVCYTAGIPDTSIDLNSLSEEIKQSDSLHQPVSITIEQINSRLGLKLEAQEIIGLLSNVEFEVSESDNGLKVKAPFWRTDIEIMEDVVEEVGRLYGYDKLPEVLPKRNISPAPLNPLLKAKNAIRSNLSAAGANEVLTYSFVNGDLLKKAGQNPGNAYKIANALSPDLQYYRISLIPSLLDKAYPNLRAGHDKFAIFELGKSHALSNGEDENRLPKEFNLTCFLITASDKLKITQPAYYLAKKYLENLSGRPLLYKPLKEPMTDFDIAKPFEPKRSSAVYVKETNEFLGLVGELKPSIRKNFKLPRFTSGFEVDTLVLQKLLSSPIDYVPMPRFPKVIQDVTLQVNNELSYQELFELVSSKVDELKPENTHFSLSPLDIFQREDLKDTKNVTLRLEIASYDRTLTDTEVNDLLDKVSDEAKNSLDATRQ